MLRCFGRNIFTILVSLGIWSVLLSRMFSPTPSQLRKSVAARRQENGSDSKLVSDSAVSATSDYACELYRSDDVTSYNAHHQRWFDQQVPILVTHIRRQHFLELIFTTKHIHRQHKSWISSKDWICEGQSEQEMSILPDPHRHIIIHRCPISSSWLRIINKSSPAPTLVEYVLNPGKLDSDECYQNERKDETQLWEPPRVPAPPHRYNLIACTMVHKVTDGQIASWLEYHREVGIEHFYIYVNEPIERLGAKLRYYTDEEKILTLVPFNFPVKVNEFYQQAEQNDCIQRFRDESTWIALHDIDEYFQVMNNNGTTPTELKSLSSFLGTVNATEVSGVQAQNWFFGRGTQQAMNASGPDHPLSHYSYRAPRPTKGVQREKCIVSPHNVAYFSVHMPTLTSRLLHHLDPWKELRVSHYKLPEKGPHIETGAPNWTINELIEDTSMREQYGSLVDEGIARLRSYQNSSETSSE